MKNRTCTGEERDKILARIRKLLDLQENAEKIGSEGEAYAAAQAVHRLLTLYNLTIDEVPLGEEKMSIDITETEMFSYANGYGTWKRDLLTVICMFNFCECLQNSFTKRMSIVGEKQNVIIVRQLYDYLVKAFKRLAQEKWETTVTLYGSNIAKRMYGKDKKPLFMKSYYKGAWNGLKEQFDSMQPTSEETALMVVHDKAIKDTYLMISIILAIVDSVRGRKTWTMLLSTKASLTAGASVCVCRLAVKTKRS